MYTRGCLYVLSATSRRRLQRRTCAVLLLSAPKRWSHLESINNPVLGPLRRGRLLSLRRSARLMEYRKFQIYNNFTVLGGQYYVCLFVCLFPHTALSNILLMSTTTLQFFSLIKKTPSSEKFTFLFMFLSPFYAWLRLPCKLFCAGRKGSKLWQELGPWGFYHWPLFLLHLKFVTVQYRILP